MDQKEQNNDGGDAPIAHGSPVLAVDNLPNYETQKHDYKWKEEVDQKVDIGTRHTCES